MTHEMDQADAVTSIVIGSVAIIASFLIKNFYAARGIHGSALSDKTIPTWMGRLMFCIVGGMFIFIGVMFFFPNK
jgi:hypothetical protein